MVLLLSVYCPSAPRSEEPVDAEDYPGNRLSPGLVLLAHSTPALSPLPSVHPRKLCKKAPYFGKGRLGVGRPAAAPGAAAGGGEERRAAGSPSDELSAHDDAAL